MDTRIALIGVLLETRESVDKLNHLLSDYGEPKWAPASIGSAIRWSSN